MGGIALATDLDIEAGDRAMLPGASSVAHAPHISLRRLKYWELSQARQGRPKIWRWRTRSPENKNFTLSGCSNKTMVDPRNFEKNSLFTAGDLLHHLVTFHAPLKISQAAHFHQDLKVTANLRFSHEQGIPSLSRAIFSWPMAWLPFPSNNSSQKSE